MSKKWRTVSLPFEMIEEIRHYILAHPEEGYTSVSEFVSAAIREFDEYKRLLADKKGNQSIT
jgi:Arc/MetJ-type ribon-helix-helix transcriptional regulator